MKRKIRKNISPLHVLLISSVLLQGCFLKNNQKEHQLLNFLESPNKKYISQTMINHEVKYLKNEILKKYELKEKELEKQIIKEFKDLKKQIVLKLKENLKTPITLDNLFFEFIKIQEEMQMTGSQGILYSYDLLDKDFVCNTMSYLFIDICKNYFSIKLDALVSIDHFIVTDGVFVYDLMYKQIYDINKVKEKAIEKNLQIPKIVKYEEIYLINKAQIVSYLINKILEEKNQEYFLLATLIISKINTQNTQINEMFTFYEGLLNYIYGNIDYAKTILEKCKNDEIYAFYIANMFIEYNDYESAREYFKVARRLMIRNNRRRTSIYKATMNNLR